ncbi:IS1182 family transposase [Acidovorax sp. JMULE5]|uniref:IS1182 family transposase n=1 Tax=Acidovorax sp. JMULE5 TaxID=2518343 RepID=UPI0015A2C06C|nr:IS1182 family transposase [Acidovorax sp. JMULE5]QLA80307.1 IS1182 family transposase [Acidovorax sp. JMULE5]QLA80895.1 IS1182 family transposase [Acidovorax sp. JMULE5]QLA81383.1 IS1182 family transposase [Acidovorax sp. JMULE5]
MKRFIEGEDRQQITMLPECLDDYIAEDNPVRVVDVFVEELDLRALGFDGINPAVTGRPSYHPAVLLKLYIYGYLNRIQSSRRLEREAQRNVELMWLTGRLAPDFKTIADFRRSNGAGIRNVCKRFIAMCRQLNLFSQAIVAIDGSKFKAVNSRDRNFTAGKIEARQQQIEQSIQRYLDALETADRTQPAEVEAKTERLQEKLKKLREQMRQLDGLKEQLKSLPDGQISLTDPDARSMATQAKGSGLVGYNVQTAVDAKHHLVVAHEVTNVGNDRAQLHNMACAADQAMGSQGLQAFADRGYFSGPQLKACEDSGITTFVPKPMTSNAKAEGRFDKADFIYIAKDDEYQCPAGERAIHRFKTLEKGLNLSVYWSSACPKCPLKSKCTTSSNRRIRRWEHEDVLERVQQRLDGNPEAMTLRRSTVEHVFGTLKHWMGSIHFLMKTLKHVGTEMSLHVLAYNLKRVMSVMGIAQMMLAMRMVKA